MVAGRVRAGSIVLGLGLAAIACDSGSRATMRHLQPPPGWEADTMAYRERRDDFMGNAPESPVLEEDRAAFDGLDYYPPRPEYYLVGRVEFYPEPEPLEITTTAGQQREGEKVGWLSFELQGAVRTLQVYRLLDSGPGAGFFLPFRDETAGVETYPSGRYVELDGPPGGPYVLDFKQAYNPSCAYGAPERFACPVTPPDNHLAIAIPAGERGYKHEAG